MPSYLQQVAYSSEGWEALVGKPVVLTVKV